MTFSPRSLLQHSDTLGPEQIEPAAILCDAPLSRLNKLMQQEYAESVKVKFTRDRKPTTRLTEIQANIEKTCAAMVDRLSDGNRVMLHQFVMPRDEAVIVVAELEDALRQEVRARARAQQLHLGVISRAAVAVDWAYSPIARPKGVADKTYQLTKSPPIKGILSRPFDEIDTTEGPQDPPNRRIPHQPKIPKAIYKHIEAGLDRLDQLGMALAYTSHLNHADERMERIGVIGQAVEQTKHNIINVMTNPIVEKDHVIATPVMMHTAIAFMDAYMVRLGHRVAPFDKKNGFTNAPILKALSHGGEVPSVWSPQEMAVRQR